MRWYFAELEGQSHLLADYDWTGCCRWRTHGMRLMVMREQCEIGPGLKGKAGAEGMRGIRCLRSIAVNRAGPGD